jgi:hypothetical protein
MTNEIAELKAERDRWRARAELAEAERRYLIQFLIELAHALTEGNYVKVAEVDGGPAVHITARYSSLYAGLKVAESLQTLRRMLRLEALASDFSEMTIDIDRQP